MDELVRWLGEQLDADAAAAREAMERVGDGRWVQRNVRIVTVADRDREVADYAIHECIDHIVRHDPARVLREIDSKRRTVARMAKVIELGWDYFGNTTVISLAEDTLRDIASDYAGRPGYKAEEWTVSDTTWG